MQWAQPPVEANRRGSWFFLTLEIVLRGGKGAIKKTKGVSRATGVPAGVPALWPRGDTRSRLRAASGSGDRGRSGGW